MMFNGAVATRNPPSSAGRYAGMDNGWSLSLIDLPLTEFNQSIVKYPSITRQQHQRRHVAAIQVPGRDVLRRL
jgi:hypothetical protein